MTESQAPSSAPSSDGSATVRQLCIVVVDDEPDTVLTILELLRDQGYRAEGFASGKEALKGIHRLDPDVIISDIAMPAPNGWDIAKEVRKLRGDATRPLMIAISGLYTKNADRFLVQVAGFDFFLTKPCDPQVLMALVERARP